jgi:PrtD family type I secretion system ABC transporter
LRAASYLKRMRKKLPASTTTNTGAAPAGTALATALRDSRAGIAGFVLFSAAVNLLMLAGPLYMLQIYDRVLTSRSVPTLIVLSIALVAVYLLQSVFDVIRARMALRIAAVLDGALEAAVHRAVILSSSAKVGADARQHAVRDLDQIRSFLISGGPIAIADLPWLPAFLAICFLIHPWLGAVALAGAAVLLVITLLTERANRGLGRAIANESTVRNRLIESSRRQRDTILSMGMTEALAAGWSDHNRRFLGALDRSSEIVSVSGSGSKLVRLLVQSGMLGLGAYLVILEQLSPGAMIAASIMMSRALAPIEGVLANWRGFVGARQGMTRLREALTTADGPRMALDLPVPKGRLDVENLVVAAPGGTRPILQGIQFSLPAGEALGIIGPSGSGKTSLARALVNLWPAVAGTVRLDGAALPQWHPERLGRHIGYVPQSIALFEGSVAENIARMDLRAPSEAVIEAARTAGAHEMILRLPEGYETPVGENGANLSAGQRQRIALARALYGRPFLLVLDEPNSNLDGDGESALLEAVRKAKAGGAAIVMIAHRPTILAVCERVLVLVDGVQKALGSRDEIVQRVGPAPTQTRAAGAWQRGGR